MNYSTKPSVGIPAMSKEATMSRNWPSIKAETEEEFGKRGTSDRDEEDVPRFVDDTWSHAQSVLTMHQKNVRELGPRIMLRMTLFIVSGIFLLIR
jgi:hypothetical protein